MSGNENVIMTLFYREEKPKDFRKVNEAYNRLIAHITKIEAIEADTDLANSL
jgi:hypothetical protein